MKKKNKIPKYDEGGMTTAMSPQDFLALDPVAQKTYLDGLSPVARLQLTRSIQGSVPNPIPGREMQVSSNPEIAPPPVTPPGRLDTEAGIKGIQPNVPVEKQNNFKPVVNEITKRLGTLAGVAGTFIDMNNASDPGNASAGKGAIAGALEGAAGGAALGPIGMLGGSLFGALTGALKAGNQREAFDLQEERRQKSLLTGLRTAPTIQETGGPVVNDSVPERPVQTEKGELMLFEDGRLVDVMAKEKHDSMKDQEVTDIIPTAFIFSNSKKRLINLAKIKDDIFMITRGTYSENGNTPMETITMGDVYGTKGKVTPAKMALKVRNDLPIIETPKEDIERRTNLENLQRRAERLAPIMKMQEKIYKKFTFDKPSKYKDGGVNDTCPEGYQKDDQNRCFTTDPQTGEVIYFGGQPKTITIKAKSPGAYNPAMPIQPVTGGQSHVDDALGAIGAYRNAKNPIVPPLNGANTPAGVTTPGDGTNTAGDATGSDLFSGFDKKLGANDSRINSDYASSVADAEKLFRNQRFSNLATLATRLGGINMQNPNATPVQEDTSHISSMFPQVTESQIQSQTQQNKNDQNRVLQTINDSGISGADVGSSIASTQSRLLDAEGQVRNAANRTNLSQNAARATKLHEIATSNAANEVAAGETTRVNRNKQITDSAQAGGEFIQAGSRLDQSISERLQELKKFRQESKDTNEQKQLDLAIRKEEYKLKKGQLDLDRKYMQATIDKILGTFTVEQ